MASPSGKSRSRNLDFEECLRTRKIIFFPRAKKLAPKEMMAAREDLDEARDRLGHGKFKYATINSYYAVFHTISAVLMTKKITCSSHKETIGAFNKEFIKPGIFPKSFTRTIQKLFNERQTGDYDIGGYIGVDIAEEDIVEVEKIIENCEIYLSGFYKVPQEYWKE